MHVLLAQQHLFCLAYLLDHNENGSLTAAVGNILAFWVGTFSLVMVQAPPAAEPLQ